MGRRYAAALTAALVAGAGCGSSGDGVDGSLDPLADAVEIGARTGKPLRLTSATDFDWDRVLVFAPYTPSKRIEREVGLEWEVANDSSVTRTDGVYLLVFVKDGDVVRAFDHEVGDGNLACIERSVVKDALTPNAAVLRATPARAANGSGYDVVSIARPRNAREARLTSRCLENYS